MSNPGRGLVLDALKGSVLTLALFLAYVTLPVVGLFPGMFAALPGIYYHVKRGAAAGIAIALITVAALYAMGEYSATLLYVMQCGIVSLLIPFFYLRGKGTAKSIAYAVGINFLLIVILTVSYAKLRNFDLQGAVLTGIETSISQAVKAYESQGIKGEDLEMVTQGMHQAGTLIGQIFPSLVLVALASLAAMNMMLFFRMASRYLPELPQPGNFNDFRNPDHLVWVLITAGFAMLLPNAEVTRIALNVLIVTCFAYFMQGLAVTLAFFQRVSMPGLVRIMFWLFLAFQPYMALAVAIIGIFDIWGNFRIPREKNL